MPILYWALPEMTHLSTKLAVVSKHYICDPKLTKQTKLESILWERTRRAGKQRAEKEMPREMEGKPGEEQVKAQLEAWYYDLREGNALASEELF